MTARKREAGFAVVHCFSIGLPPNQRKIRSIVLGVTAHAILARCIGCEPDCVHTTLLRDPLANFDVAIQTLELDSTTTKFMALRAAQWTGERLVCF